jgi:hypothetical protein
LRIGKKKKTELDVEAPLLINQYIAEPIAAAAAVAEPVVKLEKVKQRPEIGEDHTIVEAVMTADFWVLFVSFLCGVGTGLAVMNNLGQMGVAMGYNDASIFVSMTSIWGFFGRIGSGTISEHFIKYVIFIFDFVLLPLSLIYLFLCKKSCHSMFSFVNLYSHRPDSNRFSFLEVCMQP